MRHIQELSKGVYYRSFEGGNCGAVVDNERALLIDTPFLPSEAHEWRRELEELGVKVFHSIVNTDYHPEHILGNAVFMPAAVWSNESAAKQIARYKLSLPEQVANLAHEVDPRLAETLGEIEVITPQFSVEDRVTLYWPGYEIQLFHLGGHTPASLGVFLPREGIMFTGDIISVREPPAMVQSDSRGWLGALAKIKNLEPKLLVPGINEPCSLEYIEPIERYITELRMQVIEMFKAGASRRECVEKINLEGYFGEEQSARARRRQREAIERIYAEVRIELRRKQE
ncbi:MAG: MBL fold metallo-hydrolase [Chloroflexi bacterium]|nr:MBL fold metallo-hydrolase [Chloroflexota bacterium]